MWKTTLVSNGHVMNNASIPFYPCRSYQAHFRILHRPCYSIIIRTCRSNGFNNDQVNGLTRIVADDLQGDEVTSLVEYMTAMSTGQIAQHKKVIEVDGLTNKKIKFLLHKFLYTRHLSHYGILDTSGNFEIVHLKPEEKRTEQAETLSPTMDLRLPVVIPRWVQPSDMIEWQRQPPSKKTRDKKQ